jgi:ABC-type lipoprotein export system ATPase subunit
MVTHDHTVAAAADRTISMRDGRIVDDDGVAIDERPDAGIATGPP